jgi:hypothetical protein
MNERQPPTPGVFDPKRTARQPAPQTPEIQNPAVAPGQGTTPVQKEEFPDPFTIQKNQVVETESKMRNLARKSEMADSEIEKTQQALNNQGSSTLEDDGITEEDMKLAEQLIFNGYAEKDIEMDSFKGKKFTICSTNAEEMSVIDDIAFDMVKNVKANSDGTVDLPENHLRTMRNALFVALSYRGCNNKEISTDPLSYLNTLKKAIIKTNELYNDGEIIKASELKESVKKALIKRASLIKRLPTPFIDFISGEKFKFDSKMSEIMNMKGIIPKS